jgi:enoyl-[acyl-carrier protein] reductase III
MTLYNLTGTHLITGGTRGLGRAITLEFARAGARVVANYVRNEAAAGELKSLAEKEGLKIDFCRADLATPEGLAKADAAVRQAGEGLAGLVHCAATGTHKSIEGLTSRHLDWTFRLNAGAFFDLVKLFLPKFGNGASIVAVSSPGATRAVPDYTVVGASKGALESLARHLAAELGPRGIRVNVVAPGAVATEVWKAIPDGAAKLAEASRRSPLRRLVLPDEVARAARFLCSGAASGINGQTLIVDGGAGIAAWS